MKKYTSLFEEFDSELNDYEGKKFVSDAGNVLTQSDCLNRIYRTINMEGLSPDTLNKLEKELTRISGCYNIDNVCAVLLADILEHSITRGDTDDRDLAQYLGCTNIEFLSYHEKLSSMERGGLINFGCSRSGRRSYHVTPELLSAVESNGQFTPVLKSGLTADKLFFYIKEYFNDYRKDNDLEGLLEKLDHLVNQNEQLPFCRLALESALYSKCTETERRMFFFLCYKYVVGGEDSTDIDILMEFVPYEDDCNSVYKKLSHGRMNLQQSGLVCFTIEDGMENTEYISLSDEVKEKYFCDVEISPAESATHPDIVRTNTIKAKNLFFNEQEGAQFARLESLLEAESFRQVQERLVATGMRKGFNAIFYGAPGTGKTASVYELARRSGRDILHVDMSKLKSKWVGDSEKSVRGVFKLYRSLCRSCEKAPILLFNEADAIFSKRIENVEHSADQLNNAIQNIILEEMEKIEGILIATTNLLDNLDPAFERRFIYKVEFKMPEKEPRAKIWKSMIAGLSEQDASVLAERYTFSGGNIENIARKCTVEYVLSGNEPTLESLECYCREEILNRNDARKKIGYRM